MAHGRSIKFLALLMSGSIKSAYFGASYFRILRKLILQLRPQNTFVSPIEPRYGAFGVRVGKSPPFAYMVDNGGILRERPLTPTTAFSMPP